MEDGGVKVLDCRAPLVFVHLNLRDFQVVELSPIRHVTRVLHLVIGINVNSVFNRRRFLPKVIFFRSFRPQFSILRFLFMPTRVAIRTLCVYVLVRQVVNIAMAIRNGHMTIEVFHLHRVIGELDR